MIPFKPLNELLVSTEEAFQGFANDVLVRRASEEGCITLKHGMRFLSRRADTTFFSCLGSTFGIRAMSLSPLVRLMQSCWVVCL